MNRTVIVSALLFFSWGGPCRAQQTQAPSPEPPQAGPADEIVAAMRQAEERLRSISIELTSTGRLPHGLQVSTQGAVRVLRGEQPAGRTAVVFRFGDGLHGRMESAQDADGITIFEDNPAFGELFVRIEPSVVEDLEWAGEVLQRSDLPGMADARARSPLGSGMLADLARQFDLQPTGSKERGGDAGVWLAGSRRSRLDEGDPELPLADRVEVFVRSRDHALLEISMFRGSEQLQHIVVTNLQVDPELPAAGFQIDGHGQKLRDVRQHLPMWEQIEQVLRQAEAKSPEGTVRPSRR
jgi:hypothetical protein